ncbi:MAG: hypothetical protein JNJ49_00545 [Bdellovibrionaceae bacterium]|nr:hypothetical protein [Pseudobdellovibrionaceae bacterium]
MNRNAMIFIAMGLEAVVAVLAGLWLGRYFDSDLGGRGLGPAAGAFLFLIAWIIHLFAMVRRFEREE